MYVIDRPKPSLSHTTCCRCLQQRGSIPLFAPTVFFHLQMAIDHCLVTVDTACPSSSHPVLHLSPFADTIDCYFSQFLLKSGIQTHGELKYVKEKNPLLSFILFPLKVLKCMCSCLGLFLIDLPHFLWKKRPMES